MFFLLSLQQEQKLLPEAELRAVSWSKPVDEEAHCCPDAKAMAGMFNLKSQDLGQDFQPREERTRPARM